jgi:hypothetical protein
VQRPRVQTPVPQKKEKKRKEGGRHTKNQQPKKKKKKTIFKNYETTFPDKYILPTKESEECILVCKS